MTPAELTLFQMTESELTPSERLQRCGWCELHVPPHWELVSFCEAMHSRWAGRVAELLAELEPRWFDGSGRPGTVAAYIASKTLKSEGAGIYVRAAHPSKCRWEPYEVTGPRFYASVIGEAWRQHDSGGAEGVHSASPVRPVPRAPESTLKLLWPEVADRAGPWVTELGWTVVPPHSDPQVR